ncbi:MAG: RpiB/LacA/LacB family sugar-phosphate isomerase, partial [Clostridia bacterium]|nr:RpiB/LacA/LacB family sugar-phosphate isomerase [Clostridia bacterium]
KDVLDALEKTGVKVYNVGTSADTEGTELTYIHTGLMAAVLLNLGAVDVVIGGCGTGQGFMVSAMQYPGVFCGHITDPLEAWLFSQINGGNCISLALNKGYGWAGKINLEYIFEKLFKDSSGGGFPVERAVSQRQSRTRLGDISLAAHKSMKDILLCIEEGIVKTVFSHKPFTALVRAEAKNKDLQKFIIKMFLGSGNE